MKYKILAGRLTAHPNNYGTHLDNYVTDKYQIAKSVCEGLILHDQICIPTQDYFTACGLIAILGENNVISLLESGQIKFLRSRHGIVVINSRNQPTEIALMTADEHHPRSSPNDESITSGIAELEKRISLKNKNLIEKLLLQQTDAIDINEGFDEIKKRTFKTFEHNPLSRKPINDFLGRFTTGNAEVTTLGDDPIDINNPIKITIGLANINYETYLLNKYNCSSSSSTVNLTNLTGLTNSHDISDKSENLWVITELNKIPDLGKIFLADNSVANQLIKITHSSPAVQFRAWFHDNSHLSSKEIQQEFVGLVDKEPWFKSTIGSVICWGTVSIASAHFGPLAGVPLGLANKLLGKVKGQSPKYFIADLKKIAVQ